MLLLLLLFRIYLRCGIFFQGLRWKSNWTAFLEHVGVLKGKRKGIDEGHLGLLDHQKYVSLPYFLPLYKC
jgi:hypothetical protein